MAKSQLLPSVLQALILFTLSSVIWHRTSNQIFEDVNSMEAFKNFTQASEIIGVLDYNPDGANITFGESINGSVQFNMTYGNGTDNSTSGEENFYRKTLPRETIFAAITLALQYLWLMWLERILPGRPRVTAGKYAYAGEGSDSKEDELIQRLIASGKIRRSSLSWWNTFLKWVLDMTVGQVWRDHLVYTLLEAAWKRHALKVLWSDLKWGFIYRPWVGLFSMRPLASLLSFIVVPAHKRIVFVEGAGLLWTIFCGLFLSVVLPWAIGTEFSQMMIGNMTQQANEKMAAAAQSAAAKLPAIDPPAGEL